MSKARVAQLALFVVLAAILWEKIRIPGFSQEAGTSIGFSFTNVARVSGLEALTTFGGKDSNKYLVETTGCGVAFFDYDNDGWLDVFLVN
ncbi:MAG: RNA-binding protein, partial [Acidobacteria bacterium]